MAVAWVECRCTTAPASGRDVEHGAVQEHLLRGLVAADVPPGRVELADPRRVQPPEAGVGRRHQHPPPSGRRTLMLPARADAVAAAEEQAAMGADRLAQVGLARHVARTPSGRSRARRSSRTSARGGGRPAPHRSRARRGRSPARCAGAHAEARARRRRRSRRPPPPAAARRARRAPRRCRPARPPPARPPRRARASACSAATCSGGADAAITTGRSRRACPPPSRAPAAASAAASGVASASSSSVGTRSRAKPDLPERRARAGAGEHRRVPRHRRQGGGRVAALRQRARRGGSSRAGPSPRPSRR